MTLRRSEYFREKAEQCRKLAKMASKPEVTRQLLTWAVEFEEEADKAELAERRL
jgi:hypothetical protein